MAKAQLLIEALRRTWSRIKALRHCLDFTRGVGNIEAMKRHAYALREELATFKTLKQRWEASHAC